LAGGRIDRLLTQSSGCGKRRKSCFVIYSDHAVRISFPLLRVLCRKKGPASLSADSVRVNTRLWYTQLRRSKVCSPMNNPKHRCANSNWPCVLGQQQQRLGRMAGSGRLASTGGRLARFKFLIKPCAEELRLCVLPCGRNGGRLAAGCFRTAQFKLCVSPQIDESVSPG
jgi:hypothetical protein